MSETLLTFGAVFPDTCRSVGPSGLPNELPLLGFSKERPSAVPRTSESTPGDPFRDHLRDVPATAHPCSVLVVSHHRDGLLLRCPARVLQRAADRGVHPVSAQPPEVALCPLRLPGMLSLPSEAFPPFTAARKSRLSVFPRRVVALRRMGVTNVSPRCSPPPLPPHPFRPIPPPVAAVARACESGSVP
jgi:hypothetical protein